MRLPYRVQRLFAAISGETYKIFIRFLPTPNYWTLEEINCSYDSYSLILPTFFRKKWVAKHYVSGIRHQFWQDAFALRIKSIFKI